ncbi:hypothetical protein [Kaarinaea lacus]
MNTQSMALRETQQPSHLVTLMILVVWFTGVFSLAAQNMFNAPPGQPPLNILLALIIPLLAFATIYAISPRFKDYVLSIDMRHLILLHSWRMLGFGFVFLYFYDVLPALFAYPAGVGDALAAIFAVFLAIAMYQNKAITKKWIYRWNTFGLMDFVIAVSLGIMSRTGNIGQLEGHVASDAMGVLPLVLIPAFIVPFYIITHVIIYLQLRKI